MLTEMADSLGLGDARRTATTRRRSPTTRFNEGATTESRRPSTRARSASSPATTTSAPLAKGNLAAALSWSGDVVQPRSRQPRPRWNLPETGGDIWTDNMLIPLGGDVATASTYMNFVYDPKIAAMIAVVRQLRLVGEGRAGGGWSKIDPESADNPLIFPDDETLSKVVQLRLGGAQQPGVHREVAAAPTCVARWR